jgi:hypothetical protein
MTTDSLVVHPSGPVGLQAAPGEMILFQDCNAFVSNLRCAFTGDLRVYAASGITSVGIQSSRQKWGASLICAFIAFCAAVAGGITVAALFLFFAVLFWIGGRPKHHLSLHTSGVSYLPLWSRNREYIGAIVVAINNAIVARG